MKETSARLLRLLTLLQTRREWSGAELADRLGVTTRTVRRDIDKLRSLGYPIKAFKGIAGGYRLSSGAELPPLQLDDDEAVALAIALRTAAGSSVAGIGETALRALVKLEQVLPSRLRHRVTAMNISTVPTPFTESDVDAGVLAAVATACRDHQRLRFDYRGDVRSTEPHELVHWGRRWYLVAWDLDRDAWRTFRVDRLSPRVPTGPRFEPRTLDAAAFVAQSVASAWPYQATIRLHASAESVAAQAYGSYGRIEPIDDATCLYHVGSDSPASLAFLLAALDVDFDVDPDSELARELGVKADRFRRAMSFAGGPRLTRHEHQDTA
ncbi:helix-turn-helix transcriptional regulator [Allorhizocola rhizosphaerae]|uniref:helix-turn-helix transcriptional regulator n=1 Tax=Allorhizocola rhizosphaerae TaxID=1872709 RepID=UPI000E3E1F2D|nr:YafY family protein [Allorhizocola rhizosphaerae]